MSTAPFQPGPGYVAPSSISGEINDQVLRRFLQSMVVGVTGMEPEFVRPRWQPNPPNEPDFEQDWAAIGVTRRERDTFAAVIHTTVGDEGTDTVIRNEILDVLCSFYGPNSEANSELFAMGLALEQNRYVFTVNGFGLVAVDDSLIVPALIKERWLWGVDVPFRVRREQEYSYPVNNLVKAVGTIYTDAEISVPILVQE
jgi:hypothetical protein